MNNDFISLRVDLHKQPETGSHRLYKTKQSRLPFSTSTLLSCFRPGGFDLIHTIMAQYNNAVLSLTTVTTPDPYVTYSPATRQFYLVS